MSEVNRAAVVVRLRRSGSRVQIDEHLAARHRDIAAGGEAADAVVNLGRRGGVVDVHVLVAELNAGSNAMPRRPRSPLEFTVSVTNGAGSSTPSLMTRSCPPCRQTNSRPSGANSIAVGLVRPLATRLSVKPEGSTAEVAGPHSTNDHTHATPRSTRPGVLMVFTSIRTRVAAQARRSIVQGGLRSTSKKPTPNSQRVCG